MSKLLVPEAYAKQLLGLVKGIPEEKRSEQKVGVLNDVGIVLALLYTEEISIRNLTDFTPEQISESITPIGYDLKIGKEAFSPYRSKPIELSCASPQLVIQPGEYFTIMTAEDIHLEKNIGGLIVSMVRVAHRGLSHISTSVDPGWPCPKDDPDAQECDGRLGIQIMNYSGAPVELNYLKPFCTLVFFRSEYPCAKIIRPTSITLTNELIKGSSAECAQEDSSRKREEVKRRKRRSYLRWGGLVIGIAVVVYFITLLLSLHFPNVVSPTLPITLASIVAIVGTGISGGIISRE